MIKSIFAIIFISTFFLYAHDSIPVEYLHHNLYIEYNQQFSFIPKGQIEEKLLNYLKMNRHHLSTTFSPEIGTFIGTRFKIGAYIRKEISTTEKDRDEPVLWGDNTFTTLFISKSIGMRFRYYFIDSKRFRLPFGFSIDLAKQRFVVGEGDFSKTYDYYKEIGIFSEEAKCIGLSLDGWSDYYVFEWLFIGAGLSLRYAIPIKSEYRYFSDSWFLFGYDKNTIDFDIISLSLQLQIGIQF